MARLWHSIRTLACFALFALGGMLISWVVMPFVFFSTLDRIKARRRCQRTLQGGFRIFLTVLAKLRLLKTTWPLSESISPSVPSVIVCNHPTLLDTVIMTVRFDNVVCMVKRSYYVSPFFFGLATMCGYVPAARPGRVAEHQAMLDAISESLAAGFNVLAFPETRRSTLGTQLPFRRGPIESAARAGVPIIPVRIRCTPRTLTREIDLGEMPLECAQYSCEELEPLTVNPGRSPVRAATRHLQNLLQIQPPRARETASHATS
ncbi:MAG: lysophospholipid acyltransferase family protein [Nannocystales bacterium]